MKPSKLKKNKLLKTLLGKASQTAKLDWLVYLGADTGNEPVYGFLRMKRVEAFFKRDHHRYVTTLGKKPSTAEYFVDDAEEAQYLLGRLRASALKRKRNRSYNNLRAAAFDLHIRHDYSTSNLIQLFQSQLKSEQGMKKAEPDLE